MIEQYLKERLDLRDKFKNAFVNVLAPNLPKKFRRGIIQAKLFKLLNLPRSGINMKLANEIITAQGYKMVLLNGWPYFRKIEDKENEAK